MEPLIITPVFQGDVPDAELLRVRTERDELQAALTGVEKRLGDTQGTVTALSAERDHLKMLLKVSLTQNLCPTPPWPSVTVPHGRSPSRLRRT